MVGWEDRRYVLLCNRAELLILFYLPRLACYISYTAKKLQSENL